MKYDEKELFVIWLDSFKDIEYKHKRTLLELLGGKSDLKQTIERQSREISAAIGETGYNALVGCANKDYLSFAAKASN